jgi:hypothetical protein
MDSVKLLCCKFFFYIGIHPTSFCIIKLIYCITYRLNNSYKAEAEAVPPSTTNKTPDQEEGDFVILDAESTSILILASLLWVLAVSKYIKTGYKKSGTVPGIPGKLQVTPTKGFLDRQVRLLHQQMQCSRRCQSE